MIKECPISQFRFIFILLLEGFVSVAVQFLCLRLVIPYVGNSLIVTSWVIAVFLAALALGYARGGRITEARLSHFSNNCIKAALTLSIGFSDIFVSIWFHYTNILSPTIQLILYLLLVMAPIVYWLAQTIPLLISHANDQIVNEKAGHTLAWSTVGNVLGILFTTLVIMYYFGFAVTLATHVGILLLIPWLAVDKPSSDDYRKQVSALLLGVCILSFNILFEHAFYVASNSYANYEVVDVKSTAENVGKRHFMSNSSFSSALDENRNGHDYINWIKRAVNDFIDAKEMGIEDYQIAVLGAGGFTLTEGDQALKNVTYVDIDPDIKQIAEAHFLEAPINGEFIAKDARRYLIDSKKPLDVIVVDAYQGASVPWHLVTEAFFAEVKRALKPGGLLIVNSIRDPWFENRYARILDNTVRSQFPYCDSEKMKTNASIVNVVYSCINTAQNSQDLYTDDSTQASIDLNHR